MNSFNQMVTSKLGYYVYALADPRVTGTLRDRVFYVGKGKGNRCFNHALAERGREDSPLNEGEHKLGIIREIRGDEGEVEVLVVQHGLSDVQALALEAVLIPLIGATNKAAGHGGSQLWLKKEQIFERYDLPIERSGIAAFQGNLLFVSLNKQDTDKLMQSSERMADATLGNWNVSELLSKQVDMIIGVKHGLVVSIFQTEKAEGLAVYDRIAAPQPKAHGRSRFAGRRRLDLEEECRGRSVHQEQVMLSKIRPGAGCQFFGQLHRQSVSNG